MFSSKVVSQTKTELKKVNADKDFPSIHLGTGKPFSCQTTWED